MRTLRRRYERNDGEGAQLRAVEDPTAVSAILAWELTHPVAHPLAAAEKNSPDVHATRAPAIAGPLRRVARCGLHAGAGQDRQAVAVLAAALTDAAGIGTLRARPEPAGACAQRPVCRPRARLRGLIHLLSESPISGRRAWAERFALLNGFRADTMGNVEYRKTGIALNPILATAAEFVAFEVKRDRGGRRDRPSARAHTGGIRRCRRPRLHARGPAEGLR
jgi:hypothetical protein